jgi:dihydroflavonol-4-reductase
VRAFALPGETVPTAISTRIELMHGDLRDRQSVLDAVRDMDLVFHLAGAISYRVRDEQLLRAVNAEGAAIVAQACADSGVRRLVHVSSVGAIGFLKDGSPATEETVFNWPEDFHYMTTKRDGQEAVLATGRQRGLEVVVINPASIMGPGDPGARTPHNSLYGLALRSRLIPGTFAGGLAIVDVRDVAELLIRAALHGVPGRKYLAVGANVPYSRVVELLAKETGVGFWPLAAPPGLLALAGDILEKLAGTKGAAPLLTGAYGRLSGWKAYYSAERSERELGMRYRTLEETVREGLAYYRERHMGACRTYERATERRA